MSNKTLLNESQVRQFMKLAKLEPLASGFVEGLTERETRPPGGPRASHGRGDDRDPNKRESLERDLTEEDEEAQMHDLDDADADMDHAADLEDDAEEDLGDVGMEMAPEAPADEGRMISVDDFLGALETALETAMGDEVEIDATEMSDEEDEVEADVEVDAADDMEMDTDMEMDDEMLAEDEAYTSKKEKPGADKRKGAEKRGAEGTKLKQDEPGGRGHKKGDDAYVNEEQGADDREDEHLGAEDGKESGKKQSMKDRRKEMRGARRAAGEAGDPVPHQESVAANAELVEQITKRVAARILKSALAKK